MVNMVVVALIIIHKKLITMAPRFLKQQVLFFLILLCCTATKAKAGLDSYEIYLNEKLILKQYVNEPLKLASLQLTHLNNNDRLVINYSQCNMPDKIGKGRSISVKNSKGKTLKQWKFTNASGTRASMVIPVKDLLALNIQSTEDELSLFYAAEGRPEGQMLAHFQVKNKPVTYNSKPEFKNTDLLLAASFPFIRTFHL